MSTGALGVRQHKRLKVRSAETETQQGLAPFRVWSFLGFGSQSGLRAEDNDA